MFFTAAFSLVLLLILIKFGVGFIAFSALPFLGMFILKNKFRFEKRISFAWVLFVCSFAIRLIIVVLLNPPVVMDFLSMLNGSWAFSKGDYSFTSNIYYVLWGYQLPFTVWQGLLLKLVPDIFFLKVVNCFLSAGVNVLIYLIAKELYSEEGAKFTSLLYMVFMSPLSLMPVLTNQHVSAFFIVLAVYVFVSQKLRLRFFAKAFVCGALISVGNLMRPEGIVVLTAFAAYFVFEIIKDFSKANFRKVIITAFSLFVGFSVVNIAVDSAVKLSSLNEKGIKNENSLWKFAEGLNLESGGMFSMQDYTAMLEIVERNGGINEELLNYERKLIDMRLKASLTDFAKLFKKKVEVMWVKCDLSWGFAEVYNTEKVIGLISGAKLYRVLEVFDTAVRFTFVFLSVLAGIRVFWLKEAKADYRFLIPAFITFAAFCVFLIIEVQERYAYLPYIFISINAAWGIETIKTIRPNLKRLLIK